MMDPRWRWLFCLIILEFYPQFNTALEALEGESLTLTCPRPSTSPALPVVWQGPPRFQQYTSGLDVSIQLSADQRARLSLSGDHSSGYYNLNIESVRKSDSGTYQCLIGNRVVRKIELDIKTQDEQNQGLFPYILNLATRSQITTNATCGLDGPEYFCKLVEHVDLMPDISHCDYCNARARPGNPREVGEAHPIQNAIDGSNKWWQSPSITNGREFNYVTITLDLGLIYQVAYIVVKAANAPRPGNWILEKSLDGVNYEPWQYFVINDDDCMKLYSIRASPGKPSYDYLRDDEVRCTSYFSKLNPLENGEIFVSLTNGRPGIYVPSKTLLDFTSARFVRLRLQKIRTLNADLMSIQSRDPRNLDPSVTRRYFYSVKDISVGGQCICYGHALECQRQGDSDRLACVCQHNTCGANCEICCPLFNQKPWRRGGGNGKTTEGQILYVGDVSCEECNCHGHADSCVYNATVDRLGRSLNMNGEYKGGGVCIDCKDFTTGINCEKCLPGYYRPFGVPHNSYRPCRPCNCVQSVGSTGICVVDDSRLSEGLMPGDCVCRPGFGGSDCSQCALGYFGYPNCQPCPCNVAGTVDPDMCEGRCECKVNVEGANCDRCKPGYYDLNKNNQLGCRQCFCFGISTVCQSAGLGIVQVTDMSSDMDGWTIILLDDDAGFTLFPNMADGWLEYQSYPARDQNIVDRDRSARDENIYYWQAPIKYYGNRLASYGGHLHYTMKFSIDTSAPLQYHLAEADVILQGANITVTNGRNYIREDTENKKSVELVETNWYRLDETGKQISAGHVTRREFMTLLFDLKRILIRATHHTAQDRVQLRDVLLDTASAGSTSEVIMSGVEKCTCPRGYSGLSCESCDIGWRRIDNVLYGGTCIPCECNGHSKTCDPYTGRCLMCTDHTHGVHCDMCSPGYYGDPTRGTPDDCKPCACPLTESSNNFATQCVHSPTFNNPDAFECLDCARGYTGDRCERCDHGYFGYPGLLGNYCQPCDCSGNIDPTMPGSCDQLSGECLICLSNTEGKECERCQIGYYGTAVSGDCRVCDCDSFGSESINCDQTTGQCQCKEHYVGRRCDRCEVNYWGLEMGKGCLPCECNHQGSYFDQCNSLTGQCRCKNLVTGQKCDRCIEGYYGLISLGECRACEPCDKPGHICHPETGACVCPPNTMGDRCEMCIDTYYGYDPITGCKPCDCDPYGSLDNNCDPLTGQCACKADYNGTQCQSCLFEFYGFPDCNLCLCSVEGTNPESCDPRGACQCSEPDGQCDCKENAVGRTCSQCVENSFGLNADNPSGCTDCFCFGRSDKCAQAPYVWTQVSTPARSVAIDSRATQQVTRHRAGFYVIPDDVTWTRVPQYSTIAEPLYWRLSNYTGDKTLSYNGDLKFSVMHGTLGNTYFAEDEKLLKRPLVVLIGYGIPLMYVSEAMWEADREHSFTVKLHENYWRTQRNGRVSRDTMMIILQNVTDILVRGSWDMSPTSLELSDVRLDVAAHGDTVVGEPALGIEQCECPEQYAGLSCQDPAKGYYRKHYVGPTDMTILIRVIGTVELCNCFGHSGDCDPNTGVCEECLHNTVGPNCEVCAPGYYGDPTQGTTTDCQRCACPLEVPSNNFSPTCERVSGNLICTACQEGYIGDRCEFCAAGFYGNPSTPGGSCQPCNCNPEGSVDLNCDSNGRCVCLPGILGDRCDQCQPRHAVVSGTCISCDEGCTRELMLDMDELEAKLNNLPFNLSDPNITVPFGRLRRIEEDAKKLQEQLENLRFAEINRLKSDVESLSVEADQLLTRSEASLDKSNQNQEDAGILLTNATELEAKLTQQQTDVEAFVNEMEEMMLGTFHNKSKINTTAALLAAQQILEEIRGRDFRDDERMAFEESRVAEELSDRIKVLHGRVMNTSEVEAKYKDLDKRLDDLEDHIASSINTSEQTGFKIKALRAVLDKMKTVVNETELMQNEISYNTEEAVQSLKDGDIALEDALENTRNIEREVSTLDAAIIPLEEKERGLRERINDSAVMVDKAWAHANNLTRYAEELEKTFAGTKSAAADPLKAAKVYENIAEAIDEAERAAKKAKQDAYNATNIADPIQLKEDVEASLKLSQDLLEEANQTDRDVKDLNEDLTSINKDLNAVQETQVKAIDMNQQILTEIGKLPRDLVDRMSKVKSSTDMTERESAEIADRADQINEKVDKEMIPKIRELQEIHSGDFEDIRVTLRGARTDLDAIKNLTDSLDLRYEQTRRLNSDVGDKLRKLKQSILEAREEANKVKTSLKSEGQCVRKFPSKTRPGTINTINFAFKTSEPNRDMLFLLIQNNQIPEGDRDKEFLAVELRQGKVRFSWNNGKGVGRIDHDLVIKSEADVISETESWYRVIAERIDRLGRLTVHSLAKEPGPPQTKTSGVGSSVMTLGNATEFFVAGVPAEHDIPPGLTRLNFTGCMGGMYIDEQPLGLYNFEKSAQEHCMGCLEVPSLTPTGNVYTFDGAGYAVMDKGFNQAIYNGFAIDFSTYWENATLLFVGNKENGEYMSLSLENGHIVYQYYLGKGSHGRITTDFKYNRNKWVSVSLIRNGYFGILEIDRKTEEKMIQANPGDYYLNIIGSHLNFGGIPSDVDISVFEKASGKQIVTDNFLGCMKSLQVSYDTLNLWEGKTTVGVTEGCKDSGLRLIGFYGEGFAEYPGHSLDAAEADLSISFATTQNNALLLLAKDINGDSFYSLSLVNGRIEGWFSGINNQDRPSRDGPVTLTTTQTYNDGQTHNIAVKKTDRKIEIYVDDNQVAEGRLLRNFDKIIVREDGGLYLGGVPEGLNVANMAGSDASLDGCLSDIVIGTNVLNINKPKQYDKADIGRCSHARPQADQSSPTPFSVSDGAPGPRTSPISGPQEIRLKTPELVPETVSPAPSACAATPLLNTFESGAFTFGEEKTSFLRINVTKKEILRNFEIKFDFRTYHKDGMLLYLSNKDQSSFFAVQLKKGAVVLTYENRGKVKEVKVRPANSVTDGEWHTALIQKDQKRVTLIVDNEDSRSGRIAKKLKVDITLFVGGLPSSFVSLVDDKIVKHSVRGCIRNVTINDDLKEPADITLVRGVMQCYTDVVEGAHFTGNSYAMIEDGMSLDTDISVSLELRTHKKDGILMIADGSNGSPVLSLRLKDGQVKLTVKTLAGKQSVKSNFNSDFYLCDNQWHRVEASVISGVITLQVDNQPSQSRTISGPVTDGSRFGGAPVFIGGLPGSTDEFEGCMRKVKIQGENVDWFSATSAENIYKSACPVT